MADSQLLHQKSDAKQVLLRESCDKIATMDDTLYSRFETVAKPYAKEFLKRLLPELQKRGYRAVVTGSDKSPINAIDRDVERGWGLEISYGKHTDEERVFLDVMITDGDERGFEKPNQAGVLLEAVAMGGDVVLTHAPYNLTREVGVSEPWEIAERVRQLPSAADVVTTLAAWIETYAPIKAPSPS